MKDNQLPEISVEGIMKKMGEEIAKRQGSIHTGAPWDNRNPALRDSATGMHREGPLSREQSREGLVKRFLWQYGTKYAGVIKKIPVLRDFAERYYWKLSGDTPTPQAPASSPFLMHGSGILDTNLNYLGFREQLRHEGLKGIVKRLIFCFIGFFAWWQGQINKALHDSLARQEARLAQQEAALAERDKIIEDLTYRISVLSRAQDAVYDELTEHRSEMDGHRREIMKHLDRGRPE